MGEHMSELRIELFGHARVTAPNSSTPIRLQRTSESLLVYLLLYSRPLCTRDQVIGAIWGDHGEQSARSCLNTALWRLRSALESITAPTGKYLVVLPTGEIGFNWESDYWLDVNQFASKLEPLLRRPTSQLDRSDVEAAENSLRLYQGDLLVDIDRDWALRERESLRQLYLNGLAKLSDHYANIGEPVRSLSHAQQILELDPLREEIHRRVMQLHADMGQRSLAIRQYDRCCQFLRTELGILPMEETTALYQRIAGTDPSSHPNDDLDLQPLQRALVELQHAAQRIEYARAQVLRAMAQAQDHVVRTGVGERPGRLPTAKRSTV